MPSARVASAHGDDQCIEFRFDRTEIGHQRLLRHGRNGELDCLARIEATVAVERASPLAIVLAALRVDAHARRRMSFTSSTRSAGLRSTISAATPAAPGQALEVPPKLLV
jgi:hypothetical protein